MWNGSGVNGTAARDESKYERAYLKSPNTVRYLSHMIARERAVVHLTVSRRQRGRNRSEVIRRVIPIPEGTRISQVINVWSRISNADRGLI